MRSLIKNPVVIAVASLGLVLASAPAWATSVPSAPEIDASVMPAAIGLLGAGMLMLRSRFGRK